MTRRASRKSRLRHSLPGSTTCRIRTDSHPLLDGLQEPHYRGCRRSRHRHFPAPHVRHPRQPTVAGHRLDPSSAASAMHDPVATPPVSMTLPPGLRAALDDLEEALAAMGSGDPAPYAALWAIPRRHAVRRLGADRARPRAGDEDVRLGCGPILRRRFRPAPRRHRAQRRPRLHRGFRAWAGAYRRRRDRPDDHPRHPRSATPRRRLADRPPARRLPARRSTVEAYSEDAAIPASDFTKWVSALDELCGHRS